MFNHKTMNESPFPFSRSNDITPYKRLSVEEREGHSVKEICMLNLDAAYIFFQSLDKSTTKSILQSLITSSPPFLIGLPDFPSLTCKHSKRYTEC